MVEKDTREGGRAPAGAGSGDRGCTLTHRHKINTFFSLHRRPGDNHEIMWPARASERHRNVWLPLRSVITHPRRAKPPPSVATCYVSLHRRQLSGNVYSRFRYRLSNRSSRGRRGLRGLVTRPTAIRGPTKCLINRAAVKIVIVVQRGSIRSK